MSGVARCEFILVKSALKPHKAWLISCPTSSYLADHGQRILTNAGTEQGWPVSMDPSSKEWVFQKPYTSALVPSFKDALLLSPKCQR